VTSSDSRIEYERRMHRVIEVIDRRLDQPLDLASLAEVAHFSPYHFHRLFAAWTGETLGDYLRRRRRAGGELARRSRGAVLQVPSVPGWARRWRVRSRPASVVRRPRASAHFQSQR
jgi:AraC family transcriptional regulator